MSSIVKSFAKVATFSALVSASSFLYAQSTHAANNANFELGINFLWDKGNTQKLENSFIRMRQMGIKSARTDFEWRSVEKTKGTYNWDKTDQLASLAKKYDIELLPIVHYAPKWALPKDVKKPEGIYQLAPAKHAYSDYSRFLNAAIDRYGPNGNAPLPFKPIKNWQVWNESNNKDFWYIKSNGWFGSWDMAKAAKQFTELMNVVSNGLGDRRNKINLVHAGTSKSDITYMWHLWNNDPQYCNKFDTMAVHSYFFSPKGGVRPIDGLDQDDKEYSKLGFIGSKNDHGYLQKIFNVKHFLDLKKCPKPVWVTEIGFMANKEGALPENPWVVKEDEALRLTQGTLQYLNQHQSRLGVEKVFWFILDDYNFPYAMGNFGVYRSDGSGRSGMIEALQPYTPE